MVPVGGVEPIPVDLRIVAATHRDLAAMVRDGKFRQDLYFRLNVVRLSIEPLRQRRDEILPLAKYFLDDIAAGYAELPKSLSTAAADALVRLRLAWQCSRASQRHRAGVFVLRRSHD